MPNSDLERARNTLRQTKLTLVIVKDDVIVFETEQRGISGFLKAIDQIGSSLEGASVADRVVGKAVAFLCVYAGVKGVFALTLSVKAKRVFEEEGIRCEWSRLVENILCEDKTDICPFEKSVANISDAEEAYRTIKALHARLRSGG